jgi:ubiquinone/menaquinone biosynthesis C-methylase UbiE
VTYEWVDFDQAAITQRYDRIAGLIPFFEWVLFLPWGLRREAVERLELRRGDRVLEVGCGTGRNFPYLREAVGDAGRIYGVDLSAGMLRHAEKLCEQHGWRNFSLTEADAVGFTAGEPLDGVLFSLSCNTMPHHLDVLRQAWWQLRPGGRLIIMDAKLPPGLGGRLVLPFSLWLMKRTMLGNPYVRPWEDVRELAGTFEWEEFLLGSYYVCRAVKP